ncbi:MAG: hypothetical protein NDF52_01735 [archaeon YNP-WB-062]|nr:hypothetical protein [Candidatus Culexarchaeum yellowstonense]
MFSKYAALVKNLRGVVLLDPEEEGALESVKWLSKRFKYRNLGLTPSIYEKYNDKLREFMGKPFRELTYPIEAIKILVERLVMKGLCREIAELLTFSSTYISPAIIIGEKYRSEVESSAVETVKISRELSLAEWKLHLRIANYSVLDFHEKCIEEALQAIEKPHTTETILNGRRGRILRDKKRFCRISSDQGKPLIYYIDNLAIAHNLKITWEGNPDWAAALSIIVAISIPAKLDTPFSDD